MVLILIGEFAKDVPGDDIKLLTHNSKILGDDVLYNIVVATYLGLYSSGGNNNEEKYGTIPLENNRSAFAWSKNGGGVVRLLIAVVPSNEIKDLTTKINSDPVQVRIDQIKSILGNDNLDIDVLNRSISLMDSSLQTNDEVNRLSDVFGREI